MCIFLITDDDEHGFLCLLLCCAWLFSRVQLFVTPWIVACQVPLSMGFSRQKYWNELPFPSPGDLPNPGVEPRSPTLQVDSLTSEPPRKPHHLWRSIYADLVFFNIYLASSGLSCGTQDLCRCTWASL